MLVGALVPVVLLVASGHRHVVGRSGGGGGGHIAPEDSRGEEKEGASARHDIRARNESGGRRRRTIYTFAGIRSTVLRTNIAKSVQRRKHAELLF